MADTNENRMPETAPAYDYRRFAVLYVDDEEMSLRSFTRAFQSRLRILTAPNAQAGLELLNQHAGEIAVLMTDQRMPGEKGVWLLEKARQNHPRVVRLLVTAFSDMDAAISAVNSGSIYKYIHKPWNPAELEGTLRRALEFYIVQRERDDLLREKLAALHSMTVADRIISLGLLVAGMSHHIRNSLVQVKTFLELAPSKLEQEGVDLKQVRHPDFWHEYHQGALEQLNRIDRMLRELWAASEKPGFDFKDEVALKDAVNEAVALQQGPLSSRKLTVQNDVADTLPKLKVDGTRFRRMLELLLKDEVVSLPEGGCIEITAQEVPGKPECPEIEMLVSDNGPGLSEEAVRRVFDPFAARTDSPMEYGINLMTCFFVVHHHGGRMELRNRPGGGATFVIRLPLDPARVAPMGSTDEFVGRLTQHEAQWDRLLTHREP